MAGGKKDLSRISKPMGIELKTKEREIWRPFKFEAHPTKKKRCLSATITHELVKLYHKSL